MRIKTLLIASLLLLPLTASFAKVSCPSQDFNQFLAKFSESTSLQQAFTKIPGIDNKKLTFPMIPNAQNRKNDNMNLKVKQLKSNTAKVVLDKNETDYKINFYFEKKNCWMLIKAEDLSG